MVFVVLKFIAAAGTLFTGLLAVVRPQAVIGFTGLKAESGRGLTEIRVSVGAVFVGLGVAALALNTPAAYRTLGLMYLAMAVVRVPAMLLDHSAESSNWVSAVIEAGLGLILVL
jgi:hypothetical protein